MKTTNIIALIIFVTAGICHAQDWNDKKVFSFDPVKPKYIAKENCKKIAFSSFNVGYVLAGSGKHKGLLAEVQIKGLSESDLQKITDQLYQQFTEKWKAAGYEVADTKAVMESKTLSKDISKGKTKAGGGNAPAFSGEMAEIEGFGEKNKKAGFDVSYYVSTGVPNYGEHVQVNYQLSKLSKELNAIALDVTIIFNTIDFERSVENDKWTITYELKPSPVLSAPGLVKGGKKGTHIDMTYTSPKGYMSLGYGVLSNGAVSAKSIEYATDLSLEKVNDSHGKFTIQTTSELFSKAVGEFSGGLMDAFIKSFTENVETKK